MTANCVHFCVYKQSKKPVAAPEGCIRLKLMGGTTKTSLFSVKNCKNYQYLLAFEVVLFWEINQIFFYGKNRI